MIRASRRIGALALAAGLLHVLLVQPNEPYAVTWVALTMVPLELPVILLALMALPATGRITLVARLALTGVLGAAMVLKLVDLGMFLAYSRGFNLLVDMHLVPAAWHLAKTSLGLPLASAALAAGLAGIAAVGAALWWATGVWARLQPVAAGRLWRGGMVAASLAAAALVTVEIGRVRHDWTPPFQPPGDAFTAGFVLEHLLVARQTAAGLRGFSRAAESDPFRATDGLFDRLGDRDVLIVYVESYGRASIDVPFYADRHRPLLREAGETLSREGLAVRSGWLTAPMIGGQSWLSHATIASGLWIPDQARYRALLASERQSLFHLARRAGYHTAAVMPAITFDWPESAGMGFDTVLSAADLGYAGPDFNWVTMPDQYTLSVLDNKVRAAVSDRPLFAQVALVSSHAPWTPVPEMVPWEEVGDGRVFERWRDAGDPPGVVWRDPDRIREQYRKALAYSLGTVMAYAARNAGDPPLLIVMGDHQTGRRISGSDSFDVPVHVIGPPEALTPIADWGWTAGLVPDAALPAWRMDRFRDRFVDAYSSGRDGRGDARGDRLN